MSKFVPVRIPVLADHLAQEVAHDAPSRKLFQDVARLTSELQRHYAGCHLRVQEDLYASFDPDSDTLPRPTVGPGEESDRAAKLFEWIERAFLQANFEEVSPARFATALRRASHRAQAIRLDLDLASLERFKIYQRGSGTKASTIRPARKLFRRMEVEAPTFSRVGVVLRSKGDPAVFLKLYKDVVQDDVDLILPTVRLKMRLVDKLKLGGSGGAAAISFVKMLKLVASMAPKLAMVPMKVVLFPVMLVVGLIYGGKTFLDYTKIRASYLTALVEHLYSLHIATNRSVLSHLSELVAEEETKEILLGYAAILLAGPAGLDAEHLGPVACGWLRRAFSAEVKFDVPDALHKLDELGLVRTLPDGRTRVAVPLPEAVALLDRTWDELFTPSRA